MRVAVTNRSKQFSDLTAFAAVWKYQVISCGGRKQTPSLELTARGEQYDGVAARELESYVAAVRLSRRGDDKTVSLVHPRSRIHLTRAEKEI
jgi:hypothetical protein